MSKRTQNEKIKLSTREARAGNATHEHLVVGGAMVVIALLIVGVFIYAGLGGDGQTRLGEPGTVGPAQSEDARGSGEPAVGADDQTGSANRNPESQGASSAPAGETGSDGEQGGQVN